MTLTIHKVVAVLPSTLTADALYAVRAGEGFDLYLADSTGGYRAQGQWQRTARHLDPSGL